MSLYRFVRTSALLTLAGRYRVKLFKLLLAFAVALVTAWLYTDIALYLDRQKPEWLGPALILKTLIVYGSLVYAFWQLRPGNWSETATARPAGSASYGRERPATAATVQPGPLDELLDKPTLKSRKDAILAGSADNEPGDKPE